MKTIITFLLISFTCNAQVRIGVDTTKMTYVAHKVTYVDSCGRKLNYQMYKVVYKDKVVATVEEDGSLSIRDSLGTIKSLIVAMTDIFKQQDKILKEKSAAEEILMYINLSGKVNNLKKFQEAGYKYLGMQNRVSNP